MSDLNEFIERQRALVEDLERGSQAAYWDATVKGDAQAHELAAKLDAELNLCFAGAARRDELIQLETPADSALVRQRKILIDAFERGRVSPEAIIELSRRSMQIEGIFSSFRATFEGALVTDNDLKAVLRASDDPSRRRAAWEAGKSIGAEIAPHLLDLVAIRNREAAQAGYPDFYVMQIRLQELDEVELFRTLEDAGRALTPAFLDYKAELDTAAARRLGVDAAGLRPWHYDDPFFQEANIPGSSIADIFADADLEKIAATFFAAIGLPIDRLLALADLYERQGKTQHAFCLTVGRGTGDIRVACNLRPDARWMETLLHEFGHAVYDDLIDRDLPFFLRTTAHTMTTEAVAELMGRFARNAAWLRRYAGMPADRSAAVEAEATAASRAHLLVFTQWVQVMTHFERELYAAPDQDLNTLWWDLVEEYQKVRRPEGRNAPDWAAKIHLATAPAYYHNYLLGEMTASQILRALRAEVGGSEDRLVSDPAIGKWLTDRIFRPGASLSWNALLEQATGEPLNPAHLVAEVGA